MSEQIHNENLEVIYVTSKNRIINSGTSKGNQIKWYCDGKFIKANTWDWYEDISEVLVSNLLKFTSVSDYVKYYPCIIIEDSNIKYTGCYSYSFLKEGEQCISFSKVLKRNGVSLGASFDIVRDTISDTIGFDIKDYLRNCLCIDAITYNEDRHFGNLCIIKTSQGYREAPVFDNGLACLSDIFTYPLDVSLEENLNKVLAKPFNTRFKNQISDNLIGPVFIRDKDFFNSLSVKTPQEIRALEVIKIGLNRMRGIAWEEY